MTCKSRMEYLISDYKPAPLPFTQEKRGIRRMLLQCWSTVFDAGPTLKQHWVNASCLLGTY